LKIGLIGTFDIENFGDCLFPEVYANELSKRLPDLEFEVLSPTSNAAHILSDNRVIALPNRLEDIATMSCDAYILIGGETLNIGHDCGNYISRRSTLSPALRLWLPPLVAASRQAGPRFFIHSVGIGPGNGPAFTSAAERVIFPLLSGADGVSLRDEYSLERFITAGGNATLSVDPVFCVSELEPNSAWLARTQRFVPEPWISQGYLVAQVSAPYVGNNLEDWCNEIARISRDYGWSVILLPLCHFLHDQILLWSAQRILSEQGVRAHLIKGKLNVRDTVGVLSGSSAYCGSSLHGAVVSLSFAKPVAVLGSGTRSKQQGVMRSVGLDDVTTTSVSEMGLCMANALRYDMDSVRDSAVALAGQGADLLSRQLVANRVETAKIPQATLDYLLDLDQASVKGIGKTIKRSILRVTKNTKTLGPTYFSARRWLRKHYA
jgi:polysaccharide pyruvyl transferase WcaK-like protein